MFLCRPKKPYVLHYQNGTAYTYLGLKCSTRVFYCSIHKVRTFDLKMYSISLSVRYHKSCQCSWNVA